MIALFCRLLCVYVGFVLVTYTLIQLNACGLMVNKICCTMFPCDNLFQSFSIRTAAFTLVLKI
jgi:hypothetical protein